jgi:hypothetical protein
MSTTETATKRAEAIREELEQLNPNASYFEPAKYLDAALIGQSAGPANQPSVPVYSRALLEVALAQSFIDAANGDCEETETYVESGVLERDVSEWMEFNLLGGEMAPIVVRIASEATS